MKNQFWALGALMTILALPAFAQQVPALDGSAGGGAALPVVQMISNTPVLLDAKEAHGIKLANQWKQHPDKPVRGNDGSVKYLFGATLPTLACTPLQVCSIKLQQGEIVNDVHAGDAVRWKITPATEGNGAGETTVLIVKPTDAGLVTNLIITTDRRIYTIKLASTRKDWMPVLSFDYPEDVNRAWATYYEKRSRQALGNTMTSGQNVANLDFNFSMSGDNPSWKPVRVYTDGVKTYIQFTSASPSESPALVALGGGKEELVNYRMIGDRYVVDKVLDHAALIVGVGSAQTKVEINRTRGR